MALLRAMNTAISGLQTHQQGIDVTGNNLANATTIAFKQSRANFETLLSQTLRFGIAAGGNSGGVDPLQIGLGVSVGQIQRLFTQGALKPTGLNSDLAIEGDGFFIEKDQSGQQVFSRDGSFSLNPAQLLHNASTGNLVQGLQADLTTFTVPAAGAPTSISIPIGDLTIAKATEAATFEGNLNSGGTTAADGTVLESEPLFAGALTTPATAGTLLTALGKSNGGSPPAFLSLGLVAGETITLEALKAGRKISGTFVVGSPPPLGGSTVGDLRLFIQRTLGIQEGTAPGGELHGAIRRDPIGTLIGDTIDLTGAAATGTVTFTAVTAPDTPDIGSAVTVAGVTFTAIAAGGPRGATDFFVGASAIAAADNLADAINTNPTTSPLVIASTSPTAAPGVVTITARTPGAAGSLLTLVEVADPGAEIVVSGAGTLAGGGAGVDSVATTGGDPQTITLTDVDLDFAAAGVQRGDFIRFTSGPNGGQIGRIIAVGLADGLASDTTITFEAEGTNTLPVDLDAYFIHEAAEVDIGVGPAGALADGLDPASPEGAFRLSGNVGTENAIRNIKLSDGVGAVLFNWTEEVAASGESFYSESVVFDSLGTPHRMEWTYALVGKSDTTSIWRFFVESADNTTVPGVTEERNVGTGLVTFDRDGKFVSATGTTISLDLAATGATTPLIFTIDYSDVTGFTSTTNAVGKPINMSAVEQITQDGFELGVLNDFGVAGDGLISGLFSNGLQRDLGRVLIARFPNNNGLIEVGRNVFEIGVNSGAAVIGTPGTFGRGFVRQGLLEESNVDLAVQFTDLIVNQRAFQANARTIGVANEMLRDLINLA